MVHQSPLCRPLCRPFVHRHHLSLSFFGFQHTPACAAMMTTSTALRSLTVTVMITLLLSLSHLQVCAALPQGPCAFGWYYYDNVLGLEKSASCIREFTFANDAVVSAMGASGSTFAEANRICDLLRPGAHLLTISSRTSKNEPSGLLATFLNEVASTTVGYLGCFQVCVARLGCSKNL